MSDFSFLGQLPASKSLMNRALIVQSYFPYFKVAGESSCDDVRALLRGLDQMHRGVEMDCGAGGTSFRFLALRASRISGRHILNGTERLFSRPQDELLKILRQLSVEARIENNQLIIESEGWHPMGDGVHIHSERSSQFATAVLINAWSLKFPLALSLSRKRVSESYWEMTKKLMKQLGMKFEEFDGDIRVAADQNLNGDEYKPEMDMSSAFAVAAAAVVGGQARFTGFPEESLQPDFCFTNILQYMNASVRREGAALIVEKTDKINGIEVSLADCPDMAPVLGVLCALAAGASRITGASHLKYKESHRIQKTVELINKMGRKAIELEDGFCVEEGEAQIPTESFSFHPDEDHRLAMAAGVAMKAGYPVALEHREVVSKSFPQFWQVIGV